MPPIAHPPAFYAKIAGICFVVRMLPGVSKRLKKEKGTESAGRSCFDRRNIGDLNLDLED